MSLTRDSAVWTFLFVAGVATFLGGHFDILLKAFPSLGPVWEARIELTAALSGFIAGYLKMSPLMLSPDNPMAGTAEPAPPITPISVSPETKSEDTMKAATVVRPLFVLLAAVSLLAATACASAGLKAKQATVIGLQASEAALEGAQSIERSLCFNSPTLESGPVCTNPVASNVGLTKLVDDPTSAGTKIPVHQLISRYFVKAYDAEILAGTAVQAWKSGDPAPTTVAAYQANITSALSVAQSLIPNTLTQPLVDKLQLAVNNGAAIATALGAK